MKTLNLKKYLVAIVAGCFSLVALTNCSPQTQNEAEQAGDDIEQGVENMGDNMEDAADNMSANFETEKEEFQTKLQSKINELQNEMATATGEAKNEYQEKVDMLQSDLDQLENSTEENWMDVKAGINETMEEIDAEI